MKASATSYTCLLLAVGVLACRDNAAPIARGPAIEIAVDDASRTVVIDRAISLSSLVSAAPARWVEVRAEAADGRWLEVPTPTTTYPDGELRLTVERGRVAINVVVNEQTLASLGAVTRVRISTQLATPGAITIVRGGTQHLWKDTREVPLREVVGDAHGVRVIGEGEITLTSIEHAVLKANQRGEYVLRVWDNGTEHPTQEVRRVTKIVVE